MPFIRLTDYCYRLRVPFDDIYTSVFLITTEKGNILVDCATYSTDVTEHIIPALNSFGIDLETISYLFLTHSHSDHAGGLTTILKNMPRITILSFSKEICNKYTNSHFLADKECILDHLVCYSLPGHSDDAGGILDLRTDALITGDSIQLWGIGKYGCGVGDATQYKKTIKRIIKVSPNRLYPSHAYFPFGDCAISKEAVKNYLIESKNVFDKLINWTFDFYNKGETDPTKISECINKYIQIVTPNAPIIPAWTISSILKDIKN